MIIDEERAYSLTKFSGKTGNKSIKESDHNTLILELSINWNTGVYDDKKRIEIFNYKNKDDFKKFIEITMINEDLDSLFNDENHDIEIETQKWLKNVNKIISSSFSKIRIKKEKI